MVDGTSARESASPNIMVPQAAYQQGPDVMWHESIKKARDLWWPSDRCGAVPIWCQMKRGEDGVGPYIYGSSFRTGSRTWANPLNQAVQFTGLPSRSVLATFTSSLRLPIWYDKGSTSISSLSSSHLERIITPFRPFLPLWLS